MPNSSSSAITSSTVSSESAPRSATKAFSFVTSDSGTLDCIGKLAAARGLAVGQLLAQTQSITLGTTMATNVVATLSGPRMGTIATKGYRLRMTFPQVSKVEWREGPQDMYDFRAEPPQPLTPYHLMTEVEERLDYRGRVVTALKVPEYYATD